MHTIWSWLVGQVWPNLFASVLWAAPAFTWHHRKIKQHVALAVAAAQPSTQPEKETAA